MPSLKRPTYCRRCYACFQLLSARPRPTRATYCDRPAQSRMRATENDRNGRALDYEGTATVSRPPMRYRESQRHSMGNLTKDGAKMASRDSCRALHSTRPRLSRPRSRSALHIMLREASFAFYDSEQAGQRRKHRNIPYSSTPTDETS